MASRNGRARLAPLPRSTVRRDNDFGGRKFIVVLPFNLTPGAMPASKIPDFLLRPQLMPTSASSVPAAQGQSAGGRGGRNIRFVARAHIPSVFQSACVEIAPALRVARRVDLELL